MDDIVSPDIPLRQCYICENFYPATFDYFYVCKMRKDGMEARCKQCNKMRRCRPKTIPDGYKRCPECKQILLVTSQNFNRDKETPTGLAYQCKKCAIAQTRRYQKKSTHYQTAKPKYDKRHYHKHRQKILVYRKQAYQVYGREYQRKFRAEHPEIIRERLRRWRKTDYGKEAIPIYHRNRAARKRNAPGMLTPLQIREKLKAQRYRCYYAACGHARFRRVKGKYLFHLEHTIPLSRSKEGPRNDVNFVVLSCPACNLKKGTRLPHEFSEGGRLL